ncbi:hypothetical protein LUZ60_016246 [Juncus effusus]|nr:hypothetical protein LUZ60_016246 [Juncus effusus]
MLRRRLASLPLSSKPQPRLNPNPSAAFSAQPEIQSNKASFGRRAAQLLLLGLTAGVAVSGLNDLLLYYRCTTEAIEKARENERIVELIGEPIKRGPWYNASIAVNQKRNSVSCTFPVSGPDGTGIFKLKAFQSKDDTWMSVLGKSELEILIMDAIINTCKEGNNETIKISLSENSGSQALDCKSCESQVCTKSETK